MDTKEKKKMAKKMFDQLNLLREIRGESLIEGEEQNAWIKVLEQAPDTILTTKFYELAENYVTQILEVTK